jgi:aerobic carbon-monoxide dehydrogenase medium subunit
VKPPPFDYVEPAEWDQAAALLAADEDARVLAGGQSLVPMLSFRLVYPSVLVGLRRLPSLRTVERRDGDLVLGAMVTQREALRNPSVAAACPLVRHALACIGHPQVRSRGTVGGSLAHADPAAELPAALLALDGTVTVRGPSGARTIPADQLFVGHFSTSLKPGEILTEASFPAAPERTGAACLELTRRPGDFASVGAACQVSLDRDGSIADARIALFAVGDVPVRSRAAERALRGASPDEGAWRAVSALVAEQLAADGMGAGDYPRRVAPTIVRRALAMAAGRVGERDG